MKMASLHRDSPRVRTKTVSSPDAGISPEPSYLLLFDFFLLSLSAFAFFAAVSSLSGLKARN
jgi:hypothetical protein